MKELYFQWDESKNKLNIIKHGISFEEATTVFDDTCSIVFDDPEHSYDEDRFMIIGISKDAKACIISHCYRGENRDIVRIISARRATKTEIAFYNKYNGGGY